MEISTTSLPSESIRNSTLVESHLPCPSETCGSSDGFSVYDDDHGFCYVCNTVFNEATKYLGTGIKKKKKYSPKVSNLNVDYTYEYLPRRGIDTKTFKFFETKTKIDPEGKPISVGYKYPDGWFKVRTLNEKGFYTEGTPTSGLFGKDRFGAGSASSITITEGEDDAHALYQVLHLPVVSVQSASTALRDCTVDRDFLNSFGKIFIAFDGDEHGSKAAKSVAKLFDYNKVYHVKFTNRKDATAYLEVGEGAQLRQIWENAKRYVPENLVSSFSDFKKILAETTRKGIPYPFPTLNDMTYGIRTGESVLFTARPGIGKTSLLHTIEHHILKETDYAVGALYLEEPKSHHLKALAGLELRKPVHLPDSGVSDAEVYSALETLIRKDDRLYVYSHFGTDDPGLLVDNIRFLVSACGCRVIILDHITMAVVGSAGDKERLALDWLSTRLEMLAVELDFALLMVSHVNDNGETRGSRNIGNVCNIRIDLSRDTSNHDPIIRKTTFLNIPKNRFSFKTGPAGRLIFDENTYTMKEEITHASSFATAA